MLSCCKRRRRRVSFRALSIKKPQIRPCSILYLSTLSPSNTAEITVMKVTVDNPRCSSLRKTLSEANEDGRTRWLGCWSNMEVKSNISSMNFSFTTSNSYHRQHPLWKKGTSVAAAAAADSPLYHAKACKYPNSCRGKALLSNFRIEKRKVIAVPVDSLLCSQSLRTIISIWSSSPSSPSSPTKSRRERSLSLVENSHILKICCSLKKRTGKNIDSEKTWVFYSFILKLFSTSESTPGLL